jgi:16S rRNA (adenine1518-N6/adenine1519-N6)-dimethyltransferase
MQRPKKSLGQNFLHDDNVAKKIVRSLSLKSSDQVVEIGPGKGALTRHLLDILPRLTAIELDDHLAAELQLTYGERLTLYHQDVLTIDLKTVAAGNESKLRIIGNIPYYITTPILFWIIDHSSVVQDATLMMQREVAQRLIAVPRTKEYGILSVFTQYYTQPKLLFAVSANSFYPIPDVMSAIVSLHLEQRPEEPASDDVTFRNLVRSTFGKRRKTLRNGLRGIGVSIDDIRKISFNLDQRPEELTVKNFISLSNELTEKQISIPLHTTNDSEE